MIPKTSRRKDWKIYEDNRYNKVVYYGKERVNVVELDEMETSVIDLLNVLLFKGYRHSKRGNYWGVPSWIGENEIIDFEAELNAIMNKRKRV